MNVLDISIEGLWLAWLAFKRGKRRSAAIVEFSYSLEENLSVLQEELKNGSYRHGGYQRFIVQDAKRREIFVAAVRDRVAHRLLYDYLVPIFDPFFIADAWSCRKGKGLLGAIRRAQELARKFPRAYVWRMDIKKFFDSVRHDILLDLFRVDGVDAAVFELCKKVIESYEVAPKIGLPIGNLTSQIFANIYLDVFDQQAIRLAGLRGYVRYGDDAIFFVPSRAKAERAREQMSRLATERLGLTINPKHDIVVPARAGIKFLGVWLYPGGRRLVKRARQRIKRRLSFSNAASYSGLVRGHDSEKASTRFPWLLLEKNVV